MAYIFFQNKGAQQHITESQQVPQLVPQANRSLTTVYNQ